jgi:ketosteroid isomerase-like protein
MSLNEIQALAQRFADAFDKNDMKSALEMLSEDVEVIDHVPYRFDGKLLFAKYLNETFGLDRLDEFRFPAAIMPRVQR